MKQEILRVEGDRSKCWRWAAIWIGVATFFTPIAALSEFGSDRRSGEVALTALAVWFAVVLLGFAHACWWYSRPGKVEYVCDGTSLTARRGGRLLAEIECDVVRSLAISEGLTWRGIVLTNVFPPSTPYLKILVDDGHGGERGVDFPAILIWGSARALAASEALAVAAGVRNRV